MNNGRFLRETKILDFRHPEIEDLISRQGWRDLDDERKIGEVYGFVRDRIRFGYNADDSIPASSVLADGYGQCNTKGTLLMALLRAVGIKCRFHGFTIDNRLQEGAIPAHLFRLAPAEIIHSWVEVEYGGRGINLEGFILDRDYLTSIQQRFSSVREEFFGYGIATTCLSNPAIDWNGEDTYIQAEGISRDMGVFDDPDSFYAEHGTNLKGFKKAMYRGVFRHLINAHVDRLRRRG